MTRLLCKLFIKNSEDVTSTPVRSAYGTLASIVGIVLNLLLFVGKLTVGAIAGAISITADAFNNLSDAGSQIISLVSFRISAKPADRDHPFGHARIEYVASMIVSFLVLLVGFELLTGSISKLIEPEPVSRDKWIFTVAVLAVSILAKLWLGLFNRTLGKKINSSVMLATSADSLSDALSTTAVLIGLVLYLTLDWIWVDAVMGIIVACMILLAGVKILNEAKNSILGEGPSDEIVASIHRIVGEYPEALGIHDLIVHNYGPGRVIASLHVEVDGKADIFALHDTIDNIEKRLSEELSMQTTIHMDPIVTDNEQINALREQVCAAVRCIDGRIGVHDFRFVAGQTHTNLIFDVAIPFELGMTDAEVRDAVAACVEKIDPRYKTVITVDKA